MHVLVTADTVGGVWTYARELVTGLARRGMRVTLVSFGEIPTLQQTAWLEGLPGVDYRPTAFKLEWMQDSSADLEASAEYLVALVKEVSPDLLHFNQYYYGALTVDVPRVVVAHSDVVSWWLAVHGQEPRDSHWILWYRDMVSRGLGKASAVVAPSHWMLDQVRMLYTRPARAATIYNGRTPQLFHPHLDKDDYVLSVGRLWDSGKQVSLLLDQTITVPVYLVGSEIHPEQALRAGIPMSTAGSAELCFLGPQPEGKLRDLYARASLYAATSRYEPFGLAPLEAALSRCAIVANDISTFRELWGETACYFRENDAASLRQAIERLHQDRNLRLTFADLAWHRARQRYTADHMVERYLRLYQELVPAGAAAA